MDHGSNKPDGKPQDHPSLLAYLVGRDGKPFAILNNNQQYQAGSLSKWALEQLDLYLRAHPATRLPFVPAQVEIEGEGTDLEARCEERAKAHKAGRPVMLYFGRSHFDPKDKKAKKENKRSRKFEKGALNSKTALKAADGWTLLRFDLSNADHAAYATKLGVKEAPELLMWLPDAEKPQALGRQTSGQRLAGLFKKHRPAAK